LAGDQTQFVNSDQEEVFEEDKELQDVEKATESDEKLKRTKTSTISKAKVKRQTTVMEDDKEAGVMQGRDRQMEELVAMVKEMKKDQKRMIEAIRGIKERLNIKESSQAL
jgi:diphthamide synthase subunit DPH2